MAGQFYPMPMFVRLTVADVQATKRWFHEVLGCESVFDIPHSMAHLRGRRYQDVLIIKDEALQQPGEGVVLSFTWSRPVDELVEKVKAAGGRVVDGPVDRPWNAREVVLEDPNGYRMSFSRQIADKEFEEVMSQAASRG